MSPRDEKTRRQFLEDAARLAGAAALGGLAGCFPSVGGSWPVVSQACLDSASTSPVAGASTVVEVFCDAVATTAPGYQLQAEQVPAVLDAALAGLADSLPALWQQIFPDFGPATRVGIKVNCLNQECATSVPLVKALVDVLKASLQLDETRIIVWDRNLEELTLCGFTSDAVGAPVMGTIASTSDASGPGYGDPMCGAIAGKTPRLSRLLTDLTDVTINVPVLKTHDVSGVTGAMKNVYGVIDNPADYHDTLVQSLPTIYRLPPIRTRMRLHLLDAFQAVTCGSTSDPPDSVPKILAASADPLAIDAYALDLANQLRASGPSALGPVDSSRTAWLQNAFQLGLGTLQYTRAALTL